MQGGYHLFYQGIATQSMPTSGLAHYTGKSLYSSDEGQEDEYQGTMRLTADFGKKTVSGDIHNAATDITLKGQVKGNTFSGEARSSLDPNVAKLDGQFYGDNAAEVAGIASDNGNWGVVFIGKQ
ncbi:transferrin-binding protein-like solute binding protein [Pasteurellaceae bacterium TAE3-ERU1]|nr:transferrin-binding protein-like solute binding protein [Pasteurellaceae bacterium TAE3-ERU1]